MKNAKGQYNIFVILAALSFVFLYNIGAVVEPLNEQTTTTKQNPKFFDRVPTSVKKVRQHINIDIDYEKLPARSEIRLIGRVSTAHLKSDIIEYKWTLIDNLKHRKGSISGKHNLRNSNEITLDVAIKDMNKKINVRLEAYIHGKKIKIRSVQNFTFDPAEEGKTIETAADEKLHSQSLSSESVPKEEMLEKQLFQKKKFKVQQ